MSTPVNYTLVLTFDARQTNTTLQFDILEGFTSAITTSGPNAGAYCMNQGDTLGIQIVVTIGTGSLLQNNILLQDLTLVCMPAAGIDQADLSPYDSENAGVSLAQWSPPVVEPTPDPTVQQLVFTANNSLAVVVAKGQWNLTGYLSAKIVTTGGNAVGPKCRVYRFDPTVIVGGGGDDFP